MENPDPEIWFPPESPFQDYINCPIAAMEHMPLPVEVLLMTLACAASNIFDNLPMFALLSYSITVYVCKFRMCEKESADARKEKERITILCSLMRRRMHC